MPLLLPQNSFDLYLSTYSVFLFIACVNLLGTKPDSDNSEPPPQTAPRSPSTWPPAKRLSCSRQLTHTSSLLGSQGTPTPGPPLASHHTGLPEERKANVSSRWIVPYHVCSVALGEWAGGLAEACQAAKRLSLD